MVKNSGWLLADKVARLGVGLVVGVWLARYLGPKEFGIYNYVIAYVSIIAILQSIGLDTVVIKRLALEPNSENKILGTSCAMKFGGAIVSIIISCATILPLSKDTSGNLLSITFALSIGAIFQTSDVIDFLYQARMKSNISVVVRSTSYFVIAIVKMLLIYMNVGLVWFALATTLELGLMAAGYLYTYYLYGGNVRNWRFSYKEAASLLKEAWPLFFSSMLVMLYIKIDQVMIANIVGEIELGIYSVAVRLTEIWYFIPMAISSAVFPTLIRLKNSEIDGYKKVLENLYLLMTVLSVIVAICLSFMSTFLVENLFGDSYERASGVIIIQCWSGLFIFSGLISNQFYQLEGLSHLIFTRNVIGLSLNVLLNYLLIPVYGIIGSAIATLLTQIVASYLFDLLNRSTRDLFLMRTKVYFNFIPMSYRLIVSWGRA